MEPTEVRIRVRVHLATAGKGVDAVEIHHEDVAKFLSIPEGVREALVRLWVEEKRARVDTGPRVAPEEPVMTGGREAMLEALPELLKALAGLAGGKAPKAAPKTPKAVPGSLKEMVEEE